MKTFFYPRITNAIFNQAIKVASGFGYLEGYGYHIPPAEKKKNQIENIYSILAFNHPEITQDQVQAAFFNTDESCVAKELKMVSNFVAAYRYISNIPEKAADVNVILSLAATPYSVIRLQHSRNNPQQEAAFNDIADTDIHPYLWSAAVFQEYSTKRLFTEFNLESWLYIYLYMLSKAEPNIFDFPLKNLIGKIIEKRAASLEMLITAAIGELYLISYTIALEIDAQRDAMKDAIIPCQLQRLLAAMADGKPMSSRALMEKFKHSDLSTFRKNYLSKALLQGLVERCLPDHPTSRNQTYKISQKGFEVMSKSNV